jgi:UDP-N-acetylmuramoylalanine--D-glutamate ligase
MIDVKNKRVTVVGLGRTALGLVRLLLREGAMPFVSDAENRAGLQAFKEELEALGVPYECGNHSADAFAHAEIVMPSPGVPPTIGPIANAVAHGARLVSELDFAFAHCERPIIAITGTNGKTTTTELIAAMVRACGHSVALAGNNAVPFSEAVMEDPQTDYIVLEVSSYQLETSQAFHPWIGMILNVTPDHLARHTTLGQYAAAKGRLFAKQTANEMAIVNADDPVCAPLLELSPGKRLAFSLSDRVLIGLWVDGDTIREADEAVATVADVPLPGRHNLSNAVAALTAVRAAKFDWGGCLAGLRAFPGVEHRIETVTMIDDVEYVNDSKSTNVDSLRVALESFDRPVVLIAGGRGKGSDYGVLRDLVSQRVKCLVAIGEDAGKLEEAFGGVTPTVRGANMEDAVWKAKERTAAGDVVLLSPGCASFDWYSNFEERGQAFKQAVARLTNPPRLAAGA